jgi:tight adherence protein B
MSAPVLLMVLVTAAVLVWPGRRRTTWDLAGHTAAAEGIESASMGERLRALGQEDPVELVRRAWQRRASRVSRGRDVDEAVLELLDAIEPALRAGLSPVRAFELAASVRLGGASEAALAGAGLGGGLAGPAEPSGGPVGVLRAKRALPGGTDAGDPVLGGLVADAVRAAASGASVGRVWRRWAEEADSGSLRFVAAAWQLSERTGTPLADAVARAAARTRAELSRRRRTSAAVAGPRATVNVLTALPLVGPLFGMASGLDPAEVYLSTPLVMLALGFGLGLLVVGRWWCRRLVASVLEPT